MPLRKKPEKKGKHKPIGIEAIVKPGVEALYVRGTWMKKLNDLGKHKRKQTKTSRHARRKRSH
ncbi:MAG: hypothetical protein OEY22_08180 [Candidatus Bathyarchaeota archaeon]|nr:hypothetical protein [Candidatus Bathyarchaeota archaeon]MDH5787146.1 hypothetical protein [Candidatus Bathyarchaeota archaeon]